jgi:hypothetical protein
MLCYAWDERDFKGETPLFKAAFEAKPYKVWWLLLRGSDPNISTGINLFAKHKHATALYAAGLSGSKACHQLIVDYGGQLFTVHRTKGEKFRDNEDVVLSLLLFEGRREPQFALKNPLIFVCPNENHANATVTVQSDDSRSAIFLFSRISLFLN